jgi:hypothetical protein
MAERVAHHQAPAESIETTTTRLAETLIVRSVTENPSGEEPSLQADSRFSLLAAGTLISSELAEKIVVMSSPVGLEQSRKYLDDLGLPDNSIVTHEIESDEDIAGQLQAIASDGSFGQIGLISSGLADEAIQEIIRKANLRQDPVRAEELTEATGKPRILAQLTLETFRNLSRARELLSKVRVSRLLPAQA